MKNPFVSWHPAAALRLRCRGSASPRSPGCTECVPGPGWRCPLPVTPGVTWSLPVADLRERGEGQQRSVSELLPSQVPSVPPRSRLEPDGPLAQRWLGWPGRCGRRRAAGTGNQGPAPGPWRPLFAQLLRPGLAQPCQALGGVPALPGPPTGPPVRRGSEGSRVRSPGLQRGWQACPPKGLQLPGPPPSAAGLVPPTVGSIRRDFPVGQGSCASPNLPQQQAKVARRHPS